MKTTKKITTYAGKIIVSLMTIAFSLVAFTYAQSCQLLPGRNPSTLADGQSRTGYKISEATYTQSCDQAAGQITCINGNIINNLGNIYKYASCTPQIWDDCTTPIGADHLEFKTLYRANHNSLTQSCQQLGQNLQCLDGVFTGGVTPRLYNFGSCTDTNRAQCIDIRTNSFRDHGETLIGYAANYPSIWQTCSTLQRTLTCMNSTRSWGNQNTLFTWCTNPPAFSGCTNVRTNITAPHNSTIDAYTSTTSLGLGTCSDVLRPLTCVNGRRSGNGSAQQAGLYSSCTQANTASCPKSTIWLGSWSSLHGSIITKYAQPIALETQNQYCASFARNIQCVNGTRSGASSAPYTWCQNVVIGSCLDPHTSKRMAPFNVIYRYTADQPTSTQTCWNLRQALTCRNGSRSGGNINNSPTCGNCILPRWDILPEGRTTYGYSTVLWSTIGQNYTGGDCSPFRGAMTCTNSVLQWTGIGWAYTPSNFPYSEELCLAGVPKDCSFTGANNIVITLDHGTTSWFYSVTWAEYPKTCEQNYSTQLSCTNGMINGNRQTYKYPGCNDSWGLRDGVDLTINDSPGLLGQENISGGLMAQWSSPQINIVFKNRWTDDVNAAITTPWFLSCIRVEQEMNVYSSNPITSFVVNPGTKLGVNIRIKSIFTQALGSKSLKCIMNPGLIEGITDMDPDNDIREWTFEIVKADRFDLALSKSIESISQNLEAAEWAKGTQGLQNFLYNKIMNVLVPLIVIIWILSAILGFYKLMFSSDEKAVSEWTRYIIFWVIGIIFIMSARFIGQNVFELLTPEGGIKWVDIASWLYNNILYPFIKFAIYLVLGAMFVILVSRVITFLFGTDADAVKKAGTLIWRNVISMIIIIWAKQIVEAIYGKQADVVKDVTNLGEIGSGVLADKNIPIIYSVINYALWIASLVILVIIIIQTIKLLMKPDDPEQIKSIKNSLLYMFIGILVLGAGYLIVNFAIIN